MIVINEGKKLFATNVSDFPYYYSIFGNRYSNQNRMLNQGFCPEGLWDIFTSVEGNTTIQQISLNNPNSSPIPDIRLFINDDEFITYIVFNLTLPPRGSAVYNSEGWHIYDQDGILQIETYNVGGTISDGNYGGVTVSGGGSIITLNPNTNALLIGSGLVNNTEFDYLNGVTSPIQNQFTTINNDITELEADVIALAVAL